MQVEVENGIQGPPQAVAITPDATVALVGAPTRYDQAAKKLLMDSFVQVVDLQASPPAVSRLDIGSHPQGIAIDRAGRLALVACVDGSVVVLGIEGNRVTLVDTLKIAQKRLAGVSFTHDGRHALVALRDEQGVAVLNVADGRVTDSGVRLSSGVAPYTDRRIERRQMGRRERCRTGRAAVLRGQARGRRRHGDADRRIARAVPRGSAPHGAVAARRRGDLAPTANGSACRQWTART